MKPKSHPIISSFKFRQDSSYHSYIRDWQGNVASDVYHDGEKHVRTRRNEYYPYGLSMADFNADDPRAWYYYRKNGKLTSSRYNPSGVFEF